MKSKSLLIVTSLILVAQTLVAQVPSYVPTNGLVGYWPFNGNANDASGNGNNGTVNGATLTTDRNGNANSAYSFDGINNHILVSNNSTLSGFSNITISFWVNISQFPSSANPFSGLVTKWYGSGNCGGITDNYACYVRTNNQFVVGTNQYRNYPNMLQTPNNLSTSNWYHFVMVHDSSTGGSIYINGTLVSTYSSAGAICSSTNPLYFGCDNGLGTINRFFNGKLDDIGIWNRALTQEEITAVYNQMPIYSDTCNNVSGSLTYGLVGYWPFCGNANDDSGNGNNGIVNGATLTTDRFGNSNSAYDFNGTNNFIEVADNNLLDLTNNFTLSAWYFTNNQTQFEQTILGKGRDVSGSGYNLLFNTDNNGVSYNIQIGLNSGTLNTGAGIPVNQSNSIGWHQIVGTYDGVNIKLYIDGVLQFTNTQNITLQNSSQKLYFGRELLNLPRYFNGKLDDIGIWNRALTPQEITNLYNANQCITTITVTDTLIINVGQLSFTNPVTWANNITIAPNPASTQININFNTITDLTGGSINIINALGQSVATTPITASGTNTTLSLATWGGTGMYFVQIINPQGQIVDIKKIILQ
jgi:hypothetical protein